MSSDLKDYLNSRSDDKPTLKTSFGNLFNGNKATNSWFYQPLSTEEINSDSIEIDSHISDNNRTVPKSWFSSFSLSSNTPNESNQWIPSLSRTQRIIGFICFVLMGLLCFTLSSFYIPFLLFKARKFAILFTFGSLFSILSFSILWGPLSHLKHLFSKDRLPFTLTYFGSLFLTLYFALKVGSTPLTVIFAIIQVIALIWYVFSYLPGGQTGLKFFTKVAAKSLPV